MRLLVVDGLMDLVLVRSLVAVIVWRSSVALQIVVEVDFGGGGGVAATSGLFASAELADDERRLLAVGAVEVTRGVAE